MADGVIAVDEDLKVVLYNGAALNVLDVNASMNGKNIARMLPLLDHNNNVIDVAKIIRETNVATSSRDWRLKYQDGSITNLYTSIAPVRLGFGVEGQKGYVILIRDITREKSLEEERDEFISVVSHELRTPVAITEGNIGNALYLVEKTGDLEQAKAALKQAYQQTVFLAGLINDLATLSRAERGKLTLELEVVNAHDLLDELSQNYAPQAETKGLAFTEMNDDSLELLHSNKLYVREILQNFITNAIKYTEKGTVTLGARNKPGGVEFWITDTGIGISKGDQEKVFEKFFRSEDFRTRANNGTGLGLYVTMKLAKLIQAEISLESQLNKGSTFTVFVPDLKNS